MRIVASTAIALCLAATPAHADGGPFGLGLIVGGPTGLTGEYRLGDRTAIDGALGFDVFNDRRFYLHGDFLFLLPDLLGAGSASLSPYLGVGGFFTDAGGNRRFGAGARAPFGLSLDFRRVPLEIFAEIVVGLLLVPDVDLGINGAVGFRYYF